jgi:haloacetate dehalogenase
MGRENYEDYRQAIHDPATVHAMVEDYRAGLGVDRAADDADKAAGRRVQAPTLVLWGAQDDIEEIWGNPVDVWRDWSVDVRGHPMQSGHHMAEEIPEELAGEIAAFIQSRADAG